MAGIKFGVDSRGRRYKTIDGHRAPVAQQASPQPKRRAAASPYGKQRDPINRFMQKYLHGADSPEAIKKNISNLIESKFRLYMTAASKTTVGKQGRLYAARMILQALRSGSVDPKKPLHPQDKKALRSMASGGRFNHERFFEELASRGVSVPEGTKASSVKPQGFDDESEGNEDEDAEILRIVHGFELSAKELAQILNHRFGHSSSQDSGNNT